MRMACKLLQARIGSGREIPSQVIQRSSEWPASEGARTLSGSFLEQPLL